MRPFCQITSTTCVCFAVNPFNAVYTYTPSKLPSSIATRLKPRPTQGMNDNLETVTKPAPSLSLLASGKNGSGSLDSLQSAGCAREPSTGVGGVETMVVYSRRAGGRNGSVTRHECEADDQRNFTQSGIRRSCSLDGVAQASRRDDDDAIYQPGRKRKESSDEDTRSQGRVFLWFCFLRLLLMI